MATLHLVKSDDGNYYLQGTGDPSQNADFSLYYLDGEGGDPFAVACGTRWEIVEGLDGVEYGAEDSDTFWSAQAKIVEAAEASGIDPLVLAGVETDFREAGYDSFDISEGTEPSESDCPSDYGDFPDNLSEAALKAAKAQYDEGHAQNQSEYRERCESLTTAVRDLFKSADGEPLRGESNAIMRCTLTDKVYSVQVTKYFPAVNLDWRRLWDGADEGEQNPDDSDGTLEADLQSFADDSTNSDEAREAIRTVLAKLRAIETKYSDKGYEAPVESVTE